MPTNQSLSRLERIFLTLESTYGTAVAPGNTNYCRHIKSKLDNKRALLNRRDKTGTRSVLKGTQGRVYGMWSIEQSLVAGATPPDCAPLLSMLFGNTGSSSWSLADSIISGNIWSYRTPSTLDQRLALGAVATSGTFTLGQDVAEWTVEGEALYVLGSNEFSDADTVRKGGLGSFPAEPGSPTANGDLIAGFTGAITIDTYTLASIRTATIKFNTGNQLVKDTFGSFVPTGTMGDDRNISLAFNMYDDDSAGSAALKEAADDKTPVTATIQVGTISGNIYTFTLNNLQLESPSTEDTSLRFTEAFGDSRAHASALGAIDEFTLAIS